MSTIEEIVDVYNEKIDFIDYYKIMFPNESLATNTKCKLHNEEHGASFSYTKSLRIWKCFSGKCRKAGKVVEFHKYYTKKPIEKVLKELKEMFPLLLLPDIPEIKSSSSVTINNKIMERLSTMDTQKRPSIHLRVETHLDDFIEDMFFLRREQGGKI